MRMFSVANTRVQGTAEQMPAVAASTHRAGFTLVELMLAVTLGMILLLGVTEIFRISSATIGTGMATSESMRALRSLEYTLRNDFVGTDGNDDPADISSNKTGLVPALVGREDSLPFLMIRSQARAAFQDRKDMEEDNDFNPADPLPTQEQYMRTLDLNDDGVDGAADIPGESFTPAIYNRRNHRIDIISFFVRGRMKRQTGQDLDGVQCFIKDLDPYPEFAYVWYGHLMRRDNNAATDDMQSPALDPSLPNGPAGFFNPGEDTTGTNPNNYFVRDWTLGRMAILFGNRDTNNLDGEVGQIRDGLGDLTLPVTDPNRYGARQVFLFDNDVPQGATVPSMVPPFRPLYPLAYGSPALVPDTGSNPVLGTPPFGQIQHSYCDLASRELTSRSNQLEQMHQVVHDLQLGIPPTPDPWWHAIALNGEEGPAGAGEPIVTRNSYRFNGDPNPTKPLDYRKAALAVPQILSGCSQFMVEFAGDFVTQNNDVDDDDPAGVGDALGIYGDVIAVVPDGVQDFYIDRSLDVDYNYGPANQSDATPELWVRRIRWYGLPRDINGDNQISGFSTSTPTPRTNNEMLDVVPLRDVRASLIGGPPATWEETFEQSVPARLTNVSGDYADVLGGLALGGHQLTEAYTCVWGPVEFNVMSRPLKPTMIRFIVTAIDPNGRLKEGLTQEFVFRGP